MVSHELHVVMSASDRVICLNGHVCCEGTPEVVSAAPAYRELFGTGTGGALALYRHDHDHDHDHGSDHRHPAIQAASHLPEQNRQLRSAPGTGCGHGHEHGNGHPPLPDHDLASWPDGHR